MLTVSKNIGSAITISNIIITCTIYIIIITIMITHIIIVVVIITSVLLISFSDPRRGCYIVLPCSFFFSFFFRHFCPGHISGTVTRRDSKLSVLLCPAV